MYTVKEIQSIISEKIPSGLIVTAHTETGHFYRHTGENETYGSVTTKGKIQDDPGLKMWAASQTAKYIDKNWSYVTQENRADILKAAVMSHKDQFEEAGNIGTRGHDVVDEYMKEWIKTGIQPKDIRTFVKQQDSRLYAIARSAEQFFKDFQVIPIVSELRVASVKHKFGGTLDALAMIGKVVEKGDITCEHFFWNRSSKLWWKIQCKKCGQKRNYVFALVDWKTSNSIDKPQYAVQTSAYRAGLMEMTGLRPQYTIIVRLDKAKMKYEVMIVERPAEAFRVFLHASKIYDWLHNGKDKLTPLNKKERISMYD